MGHLPEDTKLTVRIGNIELGAGKPLVIIAGPCVIESWDVTYNTALALRDLSRQLGFPFIFKSSYDKANRTSIDSFRGPGMEAGLKMLSEIKSRLGLCVLSDVHDAAQCAPAPRSARRRCRRTSAWCGRSL